MHSWVATDGKPEKSHLFPASVGLSAQEPLTAESLTQLEISWRAAMMPAVSMEDFSVPAGPSAHPAPEGQEIKVKTEVEDVNESVQRQKAAGETRSAGGGSEVRQSSRDREHDRWEMGQEEWKSAPTCAEGCAFGRRVQIW